MALAVDEDRWRSIYAVRPAAPNVSLDARGEAACLERRAERAWVSAGYGGQPLEVVRLEVALVGKQGVVHHPKRVLAGERVHRFRGLSRHLPVRMDFAEREVAKHIPERVAVAVSKQGQGHTSSCRVYGHS